MNAASIWVSKILKHIAISWSPLKCIFITPIKLHKIFCRCSNKKYSYPVPLSICTSVLLKPHLGASRLPFMNTIMLCLLIRAFSLSSSGCWDEALFRSPLPPLWALTLDVICAASAPSTLSTGDPFLNNITVGTESTYKYKNRQLNLGKSCIKNQSSIF